MNVIVRYLTPNVLISMYLNLLAGCITKLLLILRQDGQLNMLKKPFRSTQVLH